MNFNLEENIKYMRKGSLAGLIIVVGILFLSYYDFFKYFGLKISNAIIFLSWIYLILNIAVANGLKYVNDKKLPNCPKCKRKLEVDGYKCKKCGKLNFNKKNK